MAILARGFSADVARRAVGITYRRLDYWDKTGLLRSSIKQAHGKGSRRVYSFEDLVELRVIAGLLAIGVSLPPNDECVNDKACGSATHCDFDVNAKHWRCGDL